MIPHRPIVAAVAAMLEAGTVWSAGHGTQPSGLASGEPFYVVSVAPATRLERGMWRDDGGLEWVGVQVTSVGVAADQVLLLADAARVVVLGRSAGLVFTNTITGSGWLVIERHLTASASDEQDGVHNQHLRFDLLASADSSFVFDQTVFDPTVFAGVA